ncbi:translation elongation factor P (EF-P) [Flavobacterium cutihirudinis]|uniref:Elongation factor P n=2 Tax=Flavobacterium cutihirudinis TaxID=1265740 RepID=A0A3D9G1V4_9FLAO|nr:translation elongation factor P (EF-P) [Flavobacterium cutihirudinis]
MFICLIVLSKKTAKRFNDSTNKIKQITMASTSDIRNGLCIKFNHDIYKIIEFLHVKPGKGPAFVRTKLKSLTSGKVLDNTFSAGHKIDVIRVETHTFQYLYPEGDEFHFMNAETFEQISLNKNILDAPDLLKEGTNVMVQINTETDLPLSVDMPASVILEVTYAEPGVKGNTATNATKNATVETGANVNVPLFINEGDKIKIDTASGSYMERVKE